MAEPGSLPGPLPVLLLHGVGQGPIAWQPVVRAVGAGRPIVAPWLRGMRPGDPQRGTAFDLDAACEAIADQVRLSGWPRVAVCGLSVGSLVALRLAARHPDLVDRLMLASPLGTPPRWLMSAQQVLLRLTPAGVFARQGITKQAVVAAVRTLGRLDLHTDLRTVTAAITVVAGDADRAARAAAADIERTNAGVTVRVLPGAGVDLLRDAGPAFAETVVAWLDGAAVRS